MSFGKALAGVAVACMLLNGFVPRFAIEQRDRDQLAQIMDSQTTLLQFFSFATLPAKIVGELMKHAAGPAAATQKKHHPEQPGNSANASADYSLTASQTWSGGMRQAGVFANGIDQAATAGWTRCAGLTDARSPVSPPFGLGIALLVLFFLLPRSNIDDNAAIRMIRNFSARLANANRVFYLPSTTFQGSVL